MSQKGGGRTVGDIQEVGDKGWPGFAGHLDHCQDLDFPLTKLGAMEGLEQRSGMIRLL